MTLTDHYVAQPVDEVMLKVGKLTPFQLTLAFALYLN